MATPGCVITVKDLLDGELLHLSRLEVVVSSNSVNGSMSPRSSARSQIMLHWSDSSMLQPVDVEGNMLSVQARIVMSHVVVILERANNTIA